MINVKWFLCVLFFIIFLTSCGNNEIVIDDDSLQSDNGGENTTEDSVAIGVYISGAVNNPGLYYLSKGSRIADAVSAAGGLSSKADANSINMADYINDCDHIFVQELSSEIFNNEISDGKVNINKANADELMELPGIGKSKAESIITYRDEHGSFQTIEELMNIAGIKDGVFQKIKDLIKVR